MIEGDYLKINKERLKERQWIAELIEKGECCLLCGYCDNPLIIQYKIIELHHIAGRQNSNITIPVCPNCHAILSWGQRAWPEDWTKPDNPPHIKRAIMLRGLAELDKLKAMIECQLSDEMLSEGD
jgi:hypothetical protein